MRVFGHLRDLWFGLLGHRVYDTEHLKGGLGGGVVRLFCTCGGETDVRFRRGLGGFVRVMHTTCAAARWA